MRWNDEEIKRANAVDLVDLLFSLGVEMRKSGNEYELINHDSCKISRQKGFFWFSRGYGGGVLDFLMSGAAFPAMSFMEAMDAVYNYLGITKSEKDYSHLTKRKKETVKTQKNDKKMVFRLPEKNDNEARIIAYLVKKRGLSYALVRQLIKEGLIYESKIHHNVVFVGDEFASIRGTGEKRFVQTVEGSDFAKGFMRERDSDEVFVFEAPIDAFSYLELHSKKNKKLKESTLLSLDGTSLITLEHFLQRRKDVRKIIVCTDNDIAGHQVFAKVQEKWGGSYIVKSHFPNLKDWNNDLKTNKAEEKIKSR